MAPSNGRKFQEDWLRPLDFLFVSECPYPFQVEFWLDHLPKFCGTPIMVLTRIASFMDFIIDLNLVSEDVLINASVLSLLGSGAWK